MLCVNAGTTIFTGASAEHFYAGQAPSDPTASTDGAVGSNWGSQAAISRYSPFSDGHIYDTFGSTAQQNVATHPAGILASPYIYDSYSASADWQQFLNGTRNFTNGVNTVGFNAAGPYLFFAGGAVYGNQQYGEWLGINRKLSNTERTAMTRYFGTRYGVTVP
jgi:hypothetical protein